MPSLTESLNSIALIQILVLARFFDFVISASAFVSSFSVEIVFVAFQVFSPLFNSSIVGSEEEVVEKTVGMRRGGEGSS